ncbi:MAG: iron ABC transporter permease [Chloracidobacterium sp.]|uniref:Iron ABC transporter permease n=2 Tax=Chloracidobacterium validum TaxID=2821543 RepID=A0ABX8BEL3_9BACT|nr:iron ABC transporter permease [Chloracidobacterium validum]
MLTSNRLVSRTLFFTLALGLLAAAVVFGVAIGSVPLPPSSVLAVLVGKLFPWLGVGDFTPTEEAIVWAMRLPRVLVAALVGAALAVAGAQMQGLFRNPLASPDIVGTSAGGALGAVIAISAGLAAQSPFYIPLFSFVGSALALTAVYALTARAGRAPVTTLLLAGVAIGALCGAFTALVVSLAWKRWEVAQEISFWLMGGFDSRTWLHVRLLVPCFLFGLGVALTYAPELDVMSLGDEDARALGVETRRATWVVLLSAALLTGAAVAVGGIIGFVGLIIPHAVRLLVGPRHRALIPACALVGAAFLVGADLLARTINRPEEVRLGIVTAIIGAPYFLRLLLRPTG